MGSSRRKSVDITSQVASARAGVAAASSADRAAVFSAASSPAAVDPNTRQLAKLSFRVASAANDSSAQGNSTRDRLATHAERPEIATAVKNLRFNRPAGARFTSMSGTM